MRKINTFLLVFIFLITIMIFLPNLSKAQISNAGKNKVNIGINMDWMKFDPDQGNSENISTFFIALNFAYFINDMFEIGPEFSYSNKDYDSSRETLSSLMFKGNIHFSNNSQTIPYIGIRLGISSIDFDSSIYSDNDAAFAYGAQLGFDYFVKENVSLNPELRYTRTTFNLEDIDVDIDDFIFILGFSIHL